MIDSQLAKSSLGLTTFLSVDWDEGHSYLCRTEHCRDTPVRPWKERRAPVCRPRAHNEAPVWRPWTCGCSQRRELKTPLGPAARRAATDHLTGGASGPRVARVLEFVASLRGRPTSPITDNGPEFAGLALKCWAHEHAVNHRFITLGKPSQYGYIENFNGKRRYECLNEHEFLKLHHSRELIGACRDDYNLHRPLSTLD